jgi:hypothetical protein
MVFTRSAVFLVFACFVVIFVVSPRPALAHRSGCHNLHTCPSDTNSYICGDLGYPCDGSTRLEDIPPAKIHVPLVVEAAFKEIFGRTPSAAESEYWKKRFRSDKDGVYKIRRTMAWHKANESLGPRVVPAAAAPPALIKRINAIFRSVHEGRNPTASEHAYWLSRVSDKPTEQALLGAMVFHKAQNIQH